MKLFYFFLELLTVVFPLALSFDRKVAYYRSWKRVFAASLIVAVPFLVWDYCFTKSSIWSFNPDYITGIYLGNLPIEEVLFFSVVPFSCLFIYECTKAYAGGLKLKTINAVIYLLLIVYITFIAVNGIDRDYSKSVVATAVLTLALIKLSGKLSYLPVAFAISLVPFLLVNGALTGSFTQAPVVVYNELESIPFRIFTIPAEDVLYCFTLIGMNMVVFEWLEKRKQ